LTARLSLASQRAWSAEIDRFPPDT